MHIRVRVTPGAKREKLIEDATGSFRIEVQEPAQENRATARVRELLARHFGIPTTAVRLLRGHHKKSKLFDILGR